MANLLITELIDRFDGPLHFRFFLQPLMAIFFALRDGRFDFQQKRSPYAWTIITEPEHRKFLLKDGWKGISKVFILAIILDLIYQWIVLHSLNLTDALLIGCLLAIIPYGMLRGIFNRVIKLNQNSSG